MPLLPASKPAVPPKPPLKPAVPGELLKATSDDMDIDSNTRPKKMDLAKKLKRGPKSKPVVSTSDDEEPPLPPQKRPRLAREHQTAEKSPELEEPPFRILIPGEPYITRPEHGPHKFDKIPEEMKGPLSKDEQETHAQWFKWIQSKRPDLPEPTDTLRSNATPAIARMPWSVNTLPKGWVESPNKCFHCLQYYPGRCIVPVDKKGACMLCRMKKMTCTDSEPKSKKKNPGDKKKDSQPKAGPSTEKGKKPEEGSKAGPSTDKGKKPEEPPKAGPSKKQETKGTSKTPGSQVSSSKPGIYVLMPTVPKHGDAIIANQVCLGHRWIWATTNQLLATSSRHRRPD